jgi:hypothetical protein
VSLLARHLLPLVGDACDIPGVTVEALTLIPSSFVQIPFNYPKFSPNIPNATCKGTLKSNMQVMSSKILFV